jgi:hypothetical protein
MTHPIAAYYSHPLDHCLVGMFDANIGTNTCSYIPLLVIGPSIAGPVIISYLFPQYVHLSVLMCWHLTGFTSL